MKVLYSNVIKSNLFLVLLIGSSSLVIISQMLLAANGKWEIALTLLVALVTAFLLLVQLLKYLLERIASYAHSRVSLQQDFPEVRQELAEAVQVSSIEEITASGMLISGTIEEHDTTIEARADTLKAVMEKLSNMSRADLTITFEPAKVSVANILHTGSLTNDLDSLSIIEHIDYLNSYANAVTVLSGEPGLPRKDVISQSIFTEYSLREAMSFSLPVFYDGTIADTNIEDNDSPEAELRTFVSIAGTTTKTQKVLVH